MTWFDRRLALALALSLLLHALPLVPDLLAPAPPPKRPPPKRPPPLEAQLRMEPPPAPEQPPLMLPEPPKPSKTEPRRQPPPKPEKPAPAKPSAPRTEWTAEVKRQLKELDRQGKFYPAEAIARGLQGEALVLLVLDEAGNPVAARIEESSGHRILDDAALRAVRSLKSLPSNAPRETLLPVRFKLR